MKDIVDVLKDAGYGVVEGEEAVRAKIQDLGKQTDFKKPIIKTIVSIPD